MKSSYSSEDRGTDRRAESISECTLKDLSKIQINEKWYAYQKWKLVGNDENNIYNSPVTLGGGIITTVWLKLTKLG